MVAEHLARERYMVRRSPHESEVILVLLQSRYGLFAVPDDELYADIGMMVLKSCHDRGGEVLRSAHRSKDDRTCGAGLQRLNPIPRPRDQCLNIQRSLQKLTPDLSRGETFSRPVEDWRVYIFLEELQLRCHRRWGHAQGFGCACHRAVLHSARQRPKLLEGQGP